ncbi:DUF982 domain-containing protein [Neorhizobium sp. SOG26]|uniref:DUF982 domain-containing protein n=1 Tax=Neorhizobium sp. SOG26 TaxID=2060726 RepID=UPI000E5822DF|nr:DUF982 domain-containing protein [Neorhizobium sp. SOG26]AXV16094.1 DUF982 domain-containing protein [Neorhizobium sp. SOG26]
MQPREADQGKKRPVRWRTVAVKFTNQAPEKVETPGEALDKLLHDWPREDGRHYRSAKTNCRAAAKAQLDPELAREAFLRATAEAEILGPSDDEGKG